jgi:hypothetical protein
MKKLRTLVLISLTTMTIGAMAQQSAAVKDSSKTEYILKGLKTRKNKADRSICGSRNSNQLFGWSCKALVWRLGNDFIKSKIRYRAEWL